MRAIPITHITQETRMSKSNLTDGSADAIAATAVITIVVFTLYLWLSGMPS
ncbi:hypothetical protein GCM10007053_10680 [Halioglobus pacificus]|uniref:Uncharacterized protein n=1 Tax=Parahalioglobus pacificus TaxID=930806 RepID=A0A918XGK6_9GAMM|nr:hypothetical protein GCM10007053_10680 [Halioglobus pacificus]